MTKERRLAIQMWREIAEYIRNGETIFDLERRFEAKKANSLFQE